MTRERILEMIRDAIREAHNQGISDGHPMSGRAMSSAQLLDYVDYGDIVKALDEVKGLD